MDESLPSQPTWLIMLLMASVEVAVVGTAVGLTLVQNSLWPFAVAIPVLGTVAFTAIYLDTRRIRHAIGAAAVLVYFAMLGFAINKDLGRMVEQVPFLHDLYDDFRTLMTTVVAFYFTADVAERVGTRFGQGTPTLGDSAPRAEAAVPPATKPVEPQRSSR